MSLRALLYQAGYPLAKLAVRLFKPYLRGVRVIVRSEDDVLLLRQTYGRRDLWGLPGGHIDRGEDPVTAGARELREEVGLDLRVRLIQGNPFPTLWGNGEHWICEAETQERDLAIDPGEIAEARWWPADALPGNLLSDARQSLVAAGILANAPEDGRA